MFLGPQDYTRQWCRWSEPCCAGNHTQPQHMPGICFTKGAISISNTICSRFFSFFRGRGWAHTQQCLETIDNAGVCVQTRVGYVQSMRSCTCWLSALSAPLVYYLITGHQNPCPSFLNDLCFNSGHSALFSRVRVVWPACSLCTLPCRLMLYLGTSIS